MSTEITWETVEPSPVQALAALFDDGLAIPVSGDVLPAGWHWVALAKWHGAATSGLDGHPQRSGVLANIPEARRMFAGGMISFPGSIRVGEKVRREITVLSVIAKEGRQGNFTLATTESRIFSSDGALAIIELQNLVYRQASESRGASVAPESHPPVGPLITRQDYGWDFATDPTKLTRFSAATANGHRIHYDWPYATQTESYPGLVVHGPLMTLSMLEVVRLERPSAGVHEIRHRNLLPLFCGEVAQIVCEEHANEVNLLLKRASDMDVNAKVDVVMLP